MMCCAMLVAFTGVALTGCSSNDTLHFADTQSTSQVIVGGIEDTEGRFKRVAGVTEITSNVHCSGTLIASDPLPQTIDEYRRNKMGSVLRRVCGILMLTSK